jgi:hypothetical protein
MGIVRRDEVAPADFGAVDLQFFRGNIQQAFDDKHAMLPSRAAIGRDDGLVGEDRRELAVIVFDVVQSEHIGLRVERHGQAIRSIRARVMQKDIMHAENATILVERASASWICPRSCVVATKFSARSSIHLTGRFNFIAAHGTSTSS